VGGSEVSRCERYSFDLAPWPKGIFGRGLPVPRQSISYADALRITWPIADWPALMAVTSLRYDPERWDELIEGELV
jgi:hypothetical protein